MSIDQDSIRNQVGPFISACTDIIDRLVRENSSDDLTSKKLSTAFKELRDNFFKDPEHFEFSLVLTRSLNKALPDAYNELQELVKILQGKSETYPINVFKLDGAGKGSQESTIEERNKIKDSMCKGVAIKINTVITELTKKKRKDQASPADDTKENRQAARATFEAKVAEVRARQELKRTEAGCIKLVSENGLELEYLDPVFQNNNNVALAAVSQNGRAFVFVHPDLQKDDQVIREVFKHHELLEDRAFILNAIDVNPMVIQLLDESLRNDKEIVVRALNATYKQERDSTILIETLSDQMRPFAKAYTTIITEEENEEEDQDVVNSNLQNIVRAFSNDKDLVLAAVARDQYLLQCASDELQNDKNFILTAIEKNSFVLQAVNEEFKKDKEIILATVSRHGGTLVAVDDVFRNDIQIALAAIKSGYFCAEHIGDSLKRDEVFLLKATKIIARNYTVNVDQNIVNLYKLWQQSQGSSLIKLFINVFRNPELLNSPQIQRHDLLYAKLKAALELPD